MWTNTISNQILTFITSHAKCALTGQNGDSVSACVIWFVLLVWPVHYDRKLENKQQTTQHIAMNSCRNKYVYIMGVIRETLQVSLTLHKQGMGMNQGYTHSTLPKKSDMNGWTHFSSWRLWFNCNAAATLRAPLSEIWLKLRLQNVRGNIILQLLVVCETESTTSCQYIRHCAYVCQLAR